LLSQGHLRTTNAGKNAVLSVRTELARAVGLMVAELDLPAGLGKWFSRPAAAKIGHRKQNG
jgi:hypothetical protein